MAVNQGRRPGARILVLGVIVTCLMSTLGVRLWFLQILATADYARAAEQNQIRVVAEQAARGRILDRNGQVLVGNRAALALTVNRSQLRPEVLPRLAALLGVPVEEIQRRLDNKRISPYRPVPVTDDVSEEQIVYVREHQSEFPGVTDQIRALRTYPKGASLAPHVLGYVGETTEAELDAGQKVKYRLGDLIGKSGVEQAYESDLRGKDGLTKLEVNSRGQVLRELEKREPRPGNDLVLSMDSGIQALAEESLATAVEQARGIYYKDAGRYLNAPGGAAVVMDVNTGEIIALASEPRFDLSLFVDGIDSQRWQQLRDDPKKPLTNRPVQGAYAPGSTFKLITASAALSEGLANPGGFYNCPGSFDFGRRIFNNWKRSGSGRISFSQALIESCDTVFYQWAASFWDRERREGAAVREAMQVWARNFGLGAATGIEMPSEHEGRVPDRAWKKRYWEQTRKVTCAKARELAPGSFPQVLNKELCDDGWKWRGGDSVNLSVGQGDVLATPVQMALAYAAVANGGDIVHPHVALKVQTPEGKVARQIAPRSKGKLPLSATNRNVIRKALTQVPVSGTAESAFQGFPFSQVSVAGKTGTAQVQGKSPTAWFVAFAPADSPRYAVVTVVEEGGFGGQSAAPVARRILEGLFNLPISDLKLGARTD